MMKRALFPTLLLIGCLLGWAITLVIVCALTGTDILEALPMPPVASDR